MSNFQEIKVRKELIISQARALYIGTYPNGDFDVIFNYKGQVALSKHAYLVVYPREGCQAFTVLEDSGKNASARDALFSLHQKLQMATGRIDGEPEVGVECDGERVL